MIFGGEPPLTSTRGVGFEKHYRPLNPDACDSSVASSLQPPASPNAREWRPFGGEHNYRMHNRLGAGNPSSAGVARYRTPRRLAATTWDGGRLNIGRVPGQRVTVAMRVGFKRCGAESATPGGQSLEHGQRCAQTPHGEHPVARRRRPVAQQSETASAPTTIKDIFI